MRLLVSTLAIATLMVVALFFATLWVEAHPEALRCDAACKAQRTRQWRWQNGQR